VAADGKLKLPDAALRIFRRFDRRLHELEDLGHALHGGPFQIAQFAGRRRAVLWQRVAQISSHLIADARQ
jgi:hypothetical protein